MPSKLAILENVDMYTADELVGYIKGGIVTFDELCNETDGCFPASVRKEVDNIVGKEYDYYKYSEKDGSNARFMEKQKNTNAFRDAVFDVIDDIKQKPKKKEDTIETLF